MTTPITIDPKDLPDDVLLDALRGCEQGSKRSPSARNDREKYGYTKYPQYTISTVRAGRALVAEAWDRGLVSAPEKPAADHASGERSE